LRPAKRVGANLFTYVHRIGAVTVSRAGLPLLAYDLNVRQRDLDTLIARMSALGRVVTTGDVLSFTPPGAQGGRRLSEVSL